MLTRALMRRIMLNRLKLYLGQHLDFLVFSL